MIKFWRGLVFLLVYFLAGRIGFALSFSGSGVSTVWPASGVGVVFLCLFGFRNWPWIFAAAALTNFSSFHSFLAAIPVGAGLSLEALSGAWIIRKFAMDSKAHFIHAKSISIVMTAVLAPLCSAVIGVIALAAIGLVEADQIWSLIFTWWGGNTIGILTIVPFFLISRDQEVWTWTSKQILETAVFVLCSLGVGYMIFKFPGGDRYVMLPLYLILLTAYFTGLHAAYIVAFVFYSITILAGLLGLGPLSGSNVQESLLHLQGIVFAYTIVLLLIGDFIRAKVLSVAALVLGLSWLLVWGIQLKLIQDAKKEDQIHFLDFIQRAEARIRSRFEVFESVLRSAEGFFLANPQFNHQQWRQFVAALDIDGQFQGVNGFGFIYEAPRDHFQQWLAKMENQMKAPIPVHPVPGVTPTRAQERYIISVVEPLESNQPAVGLEVSTEKNRLVALNRAKANNQVTITRNILLVQDREQRPGFLMFDPIFYKEHFYGWAYAPIVWEKLLQGALGDLSSQIGFSFAYPPEEDGHAGQVVFSSLTEKTKVGQPLASSYEAGGLKMRVDWYRLPGFQGKQDTALIWVILIGLLVSNLLAITIANLQLVGIHAQRLADSIQADLAKSQSHLINASKMSALGEMAGGVAHEINNPLAIIRGRAELIKKMLERNQVDPEKFKELTHSIVKTVDRISQIVNGLRTFSRSGENDAFAPVSISDVIHETLGLCQERFKIHGVKLTVEGADPAVKVSGRQTQLSQVLLNLLNNAYDAVLEMPYPWVELKVSTSGNSVLIKIRDSGPGISKELQEKIMQPFFTTKEVGKGTGLGLSISKGIIEDHQGQLFLDAKDSQTCFVVSLPLV